MRPSDRGPFRPGPICPGGVRRASLGVVSPVLFLLLLGTRAEGEGKFARKMNSALPSRLDALFHVDASPFRGLQGRGSDNWQIALSGNSIFR